MSKKIYVTQPSLPKLEEFIPYLEKIWESKWLTNNGQFHQQFEKELAEYLGVKYVSLFANGTLALMTALQALEIKGKVITTPYTFVATANALWWNKLEPVFVDIEPDYCNLDPNKIEEAITSDTSAILPVHVYGTPCEVVEIEKIAHKYNLKIIYDAAHSFGVKYKGTSILNYGDLSILSFHATKVFNTMEGGAIISHSEETKRKIDYLKNFGFEDEITVVTAGINSKMNEMQAALGLVQLKNFEINVKKRRDVFFKYKNALSHIEGIRLLGEKNDATSNYSYYPIFIKNNKFINRDKIYTELRNHNIFARRYFYPLVNTFLPYRNLPSSNLSNLPVAKDIAESVLCLPIYPELDNDTIQKIVEILRGG